jgi:diaminopimelate epimerase
MDANFFVKSHGLGNDYIVLDSDNINFNLTDNAIIRICDYHFGIGSDGILLKCPSKKADFCLKIYNPDASEAEKSGNGLRIFCKYIYDYGFTHKKTFTVETLGGIVTANIIEEINNKALVIQIDMGKAIFESSKIPVSNKNANCLNETLVVGDKTYTINCVSVGNPHCVVIKENLDIDEIMKYGPQIENHIKFPNRINLQFAKLVSRNKIEVLIYERGAGYTLASGSSSSAVASVCKKLGHTDSNMEVIMKGGTLQLFVDDDFNIRMTGEVREIGSGYLGTELLADLEKGIPG